MRRSPPDLPIEFRGYVPEEDIPEIFSDHFRGRSSLRFRHRIQRAGAPGMRIRRAHRQRGLPDFRGMAADEDMAIRFYRRGDPGDLADQLLAILESPKLERQMAEHNFAAGIEMTMTSVVDNYLRWFELNKCKRLLRDSKDILKPRFLLDTVRERSPI